MILMCDALQVGLERQPWHYNITWAWAQPNFPKIHPRPAQAEQCKGAHICPSAAYQGAETLCIHIKWMWDALQAGLEPQPWHYNITQAPPTPIFLKSSPNLHRHSRVLRAHTYAHPQHIKVLKHFVYIWYGCGMQSEADCSLNNETTIPFALTHTPIFNNSPPPTQV